MLIQLNWSEKIKLVWQIGKHDVRTGVTYIVERIRYVQFDEMMQDSFSVDEKWIFFFIACSGKLTQSNPIHTHALISLQVSKCQERVKFLHKVFATEHLSKVESHADETLIR